MLWYWPFRLRVDGIAGFIAFACSLTSVVWPVAEQLQVGQTVIVAAFDVIYVCAEIGATLPIGLDLLTSSARSGFNDSHDLGPVVR